MVTIEHDVMKKFYNSKKLRFKDLKGNMPSNKFTYHLNNLLKKEFIEKKKDFYVITDEGERFISYLDSQKDHSQIKQPIHDVFLFPSKDSKFLVQKRTKRPFFGVVMPIGSKIRNGESIFETAQKRLLKDTGLRGNLMYKGVIDVKTFKEGKFHLHHILHVFRINNLEGELKFKTNKGENFWIKEKDYYKAKNILTSAKEQFEVAKTKNFMLLELIQHLNKRGKFVKSEIIRKLKY